MEIIEIDGYKHQGRYNKKTQILLTNTNRPINYYLNSLKTRYNGKYDKIPNYVISKEGKIYSLIPPSTYSNYLSMRSINKKVIIIALENLGWLKKVPLKKYYTNWIGDKVENDVYEKKWRGHYFWETYKEKQINSLVELCKSLQEKFGIAEKCVGYNVKLDYIEKYLGITSLSNYDKNATSLSPAFDFEIFINKIENYDEQIR